MWQLTSIKSLVVMQQGSSEIDKLDRATCAAEDFKKISGLRLISRGHWNCEAVLISDGEFFSTFLLLK